MKTVFEQMAEMGSEKIIADFKVKQRQNYDFKKQYAELQAVADGFDERDPAVKAMLSMAIAACKRRGKYVGICGQGPSDHPDLAEWLMKEGIESMSLNPDTVVDTWLMLAKQVETKA